ncbi:uncharacterized protein LOC123335301 [Bubalus bubalis]|uniref:uncharacterized protein LOC123335301 n=1 Tax=Bubalus bubalis TaxID=89462 RepID=UPI001D1235D2|nr:uncharacterized protein LOC123335301 [Bubalus bubalis]
MDSSKEDSGRTRAPPGGALTAQPAWIPARRILGGHGPLLGRPHRSASMDSSKEDSGRTRAPPGGVLTAQPAWIPARRILGGHGPLLGRPHRSASMDSSKEDSGRTRAPPGAPSPLSQHGFQQGGFWEDTGPSWGALTAQPAWIPARRILGGHGPLLGAPSPLSQHGFQQGGFWEDTCTRPFPILPVGSDLGVPRSFPGPPVVKRLMQMVTWPGWEVSVGVSPNRRCSFLQALDGADPSELSPHLLRSSKPALETLFPASFVLEPGNRSRPHQNTEKFCI